MRKRTEPPRRSGRIPPAGSRAPVHGVARVLSKLGFCSRTAAAALVRDGRVAIGGRVVRDPEAPVDAGVAVAVDGTAVSASAPVHVMLNKPRGLTTTAHDERGRDTVYRCFDGSDLPWIAPVGRLDRASEGLLLFSNDPGWAARITSPEGRIEKTYHVQIDRLPDAALLEAMTDGVVDDGERLAARSVGVLRQGARNAWLEIVLDEGRNRQIRRMLAAHGVGVLRLVRTAIGPLVLGDLGKGQWRHLSAAERASLAGGSQGAAPRR